MTAEGATRARERAQKHGLQRFNDLFHGAREQPFVRPQLVDLLLSEEYRPAVVDFAVPAAVFKKLS